MKIKLVTPQKESDFNKSIKLLNKIFSKFPNPKEYNSKYAFEKTLGKDPLIVEIYDESSLIAFAFCYNRIPNYYHIWELGVNEKFRKKGIATQIYEAIENYARENKYNGITLNTFNRYWLNIRLLLKRGMKYTT